MKRQRWTISLGLGLVAMYLLASCAPSDVVSPTATADTPQPITPDNQVYTAPPTDTETVPPPSPTALPSETATVTPVPGPQLELTFVSDRRPGYYGVYAVSVGCLNAEVPCLGQPRLLFEQEARIDSISWSPDGQRIAFSRPVLTAKSDVFLADWDGGNIVNLTNSPDGESNPVWSPDGTKTAYIYVSATLTATEPVQIRVHDLTSGDVARVLADVFNPHAFAWLPGDSQMAYITEISSTDLRTQIYVANADGNVQHRIPQNATDFTSISSVTISPTREWFAFTGRILPATGPSTTDIYLTNQDGSQLTQLTSEFGHDLGPAWSPLGDWIAFGSDRSGDYDIYLVKPDGTGLINVTDNRGSNDSWPAWRLVSAP